MAYPTYKWGGSKPQFKWPGSTINWGPAQPKQPIIGPSTPGWDTLRGGPAAPPQQQANPYAAMIAELMNQQRGDIRAEGVADQASRDAAIKRFLVSYGAAPDLSGLGSDAQGIYKGLLDPQTLDLINKNTAEGTSVTARMQHAFDTSQAALPENLAGAGRLHSGETGYQLGELNLQDKTQRFDVANELAGNIESAVGGYAANERARQRALADLEMQSAWQQYNTWGDTNMDGGDQGPAPNPAQSAAVSSNVPLSQQAWLRLHPGGIYQNYLAAWRRHQQQGQGGATMSQSGWGGAYDPTMWGYM